MSYDLSFLVRQDQTPPSAEAIRQHFRSKPGYKEQGDQFWYENEDTGVYFSFDLQGEGSADPQDEPEGVVADNLKEVGLSFNINYFRPHVFGLEAELELSALVGRFSFLVDDPQNDGMGRGDYSREGFLRGWNAGNLFGHLAILSQARKGEPPVSNPRFDALPRETLDRVWRWNYGREKLQAQLEDGVFVPGIRFVRYQESPKTFIVWGDAIPEAVPDVDLLILVRDELAPRTFLGKKRDTCVASHGDIAPLQELGQRIVNDTPYTLFQYQKPPARIADFFRSRVPFATQLEALSPDKVLTQDVLEQAQLTAREDA